MRLVRRGFITATLLAGAGMAAPASACRTPVPKDRSGYVAAVDHLLAAWWRRDFEAFTQPFRHRDVTEPPGLRALFDAHFTDRKPRFRGDVLFNGASAVVQVVTPGEPDRLHGICGDHAFAELFLVKFFPGIVEPVMERLNFVDFDLLAHDEWVRLPGAAALPAASRSEGG